MGQFISFSIVKDNYLQPVISHIRDYAVANGGGLKAANVGMQDANYCGLVFNGNKTVLTYPAFFTEYIATSLLLSRELQTTIYTFHIHNGDEWILYTFKNGGIVSCFYPAHAYNSRNFDLPDFSGDLNIALEEVDRYFINWGKKVVGKRAYETDQYVAGDCMQVFDLALKMGVSYENVSNAAQSGKCFNLWTKSLPIKGSTE